MKKLLFVLLILEVVTSYAQIPSYVPTNGLVAYYPFNGNANDASGNGNNGTVNGAILTTDRFGNVGKAYGFDGVNCETRIDAQVNTNSISSNNAYTVSFWVKKVGDGCMMHPRIMEFYSPDNVGALQFSWDVTGINNLLIEFGNNISQINALNYSNSNWLNQWYHLAVTCNSNYFIFYLNGIEVNRFTYAGFPRLAQSVSFGRMNHPAFNTFKGDLDDIAIYNRALSQSEITGLYNAGTNTCLPSYLPTTGLVGYWPFCGNANDESGNGNNGVVNGATLTTDRFGSVGKAYSFDGLSSYIQTINSGPTGTGITVTYWYKSIQTNENIGIVAFGGNSWASYFEVTHNHWASGQGPCNGPAITGGGTLFNPGTTINPNNGNWHHVLVTLPSGATSFNQTQIYLDGVLLSGSCSFANYGAPIPNIGSANPIKFGRSWQQPQHPNYFNGVLDDIAIYNRALSATEIQNLYNASAPTFCIANIINNDTTICKGQSLTLNADAVASGLVTDINGNVYPTVNIGSQTWMQKNLNVSKYKNGDVLPQVTDATQWANLTTGAWCWYNNDSSTYGATYGKLYNWYAVNDSRGLAPDGWRVPSESEWNVLVNYLGGDSLAGCKMKSTSLWYSPNYCATNSSGFSALPSGIRAGNDGSFGNILGYNYIWSSNYGRFIYMAFDWNFASMFSYPTKYGFSVRCLKNTSSTSLLWSTGATTQNITVSPTVTTTYYLNVTDENGNTCRDSVKVFVNTAVPSAPATLTGPTDVCSNFSSPTSGTSNAVTYTAATVSTASSYTWSVPAGVTIVSGQGTNSITVTFANTFVSGAITVKSVNACGISTSAKSLTVYKRVAATPAVIQKEFSPTSIVAVTNVTGLVSETYRIKKVLYATSYNWSMNRGTNATITHINASGVNDTAVIVTFFNCFVRDTLSVKSVAPCSLSTAKTAILIANTVPASVAGIGTAGGDFAVCIGTTKTFNAIASTPSTSQAPIASFRWTKPTNTVITSATSDSSSITVSFNTGFTGGSLTAKGVTACGVIGTTAVSAILQYLPPTALSISSSTAIYNACINSSVTYTAIVGAPTTSQTPTSVFRWTRPNNTTVTGASADSSSITVRFNTGYVGGTLSVRGQSRCGTLGVTKSQALTHTGCAVGTKLSVPVTTETNINSFEVSLYPNPSAGEFKLLINLVGGKTPTMGAKAAAKAIVKVIDLQGRLIKSFECNANQPTAIGNELKPGVYMVEVRMGNEVKTVRAVRF